MNLLLLLLSLKNEDDPQRNNMTRKNKSKPEITQDIQQVNKANHLREVMKNKVFPIMLELNSTIGATKIFLQTAAVTAEAESSKRASGMKMSEMNDTLNKIFSSKDKKTEEQYIYYRKLFDVMKDESIQDFVSLIEMTPRYIEKFFTQEVDKKSIIELDISKILG